MCGVIGLVYSKPRADLGQSAALLLKTLEYRGYDSTGGAFQGPGLEVRLRKGVGAPSVLVEKLGMVAETGQLFCGQVRWATFGAVTEANAQPHLVRCKTFLYGAHNGNITNCDELKTWLTQQGHTVVSDNDGEMVVHTVEHFFAAELAALGASEVDTSLARRAAMSRAIVLAAETLRGSYAAVIVDPVSRTQWAIKQGSSLYFGRGRDEQGDGFSLVSSDLSAVLKFTRLLVPLAEGECVEYDGTGFRVFALRDRAEPKKLTAGQTLPREPVRSRLRAQDTALLPPFKTFMEQEIASQESTCTSVVTLFRGGTEATALLAPFLDAVPDAARAAMRARLETLRDRQSDQALAQDFAALVDSAEVKALLAKVPPAVRERGTAGPVANLSQQLVSSEAGLLTDLLGLARHDDDRLALRVFDVLLEREELAEFRAAVDGFLQACLKAEQRGGRLFVLCCGSSYHAARAAALFFNELAHLELYAVLPGEFRGEHARSLRDGDVVVAVSQSGETKDLIDVLNDVIESRLDITRVAVVNNLNSTLAQEKCSVVIPLRCGPEIAVPATKSFLNQLTVFYCLALEVASQRAALGKLSEAAKEAVLRRREALGQLPGLVRAALTSAEAQLNEAAVLLALRPSMHLLATRLISVALEGALKIREIVLNHAQGLEASEFKHGPNTILGFNTVIGLDQVERLLASKQPLTAATLKAALQDDYPLLYVTGPDPRDVALTVSQINTHKIRGATTIVFAEENAALREAASKPPATNPGYRSVFVPLPPTHDNLMVVFTATVALQRLALKMSQRKQEHLDALGLTEHGVHPDVPKNVSKSITVD
jgi:glucosamine--fructose-6-phosphate aminotransferase (isomerizing)